MKKVILALALASGVISSAQAQGWVFFNNANNTRVSTNQVVGGAATGNMSATSGSTLYYFALFSSTSSQLVGGVTNRFSGTSGTYAFSDGNWSFNNPSFGPDYGTNGALGLFNSTAQDPAQSAGTQVTSGASQSFVIIGWSANIGSTLAALQSWYANPTFNGWIGESATSAFITPGASSASLGFPVNIMGTSGGLIPGFTLGLVTPVPEPSTMALAGLGGLSMLLFRRRK